MRSWTRPSSAVALRAAGAGLALLAAAHEAAAAAPPAGPGSGLVAARAADGRYGRIDASTAAAMPLSELATVFDTPETIAHLLRLTVTYAYDWEVWGRAEYFATGEEVRARKRGDCEDYAILAKALLDRAGYTTVLLSAWHAERDAGGNDGHTVVAFLEQGRWNHISNLGYVRAEAATHEELAASIFPDWTRSNLWAYDGARLTWDGLNGWRAVSTIVNQGADVRTAVLADRVPNRPPAASGN